ncbi:ABC transporter ATP-binding protein [Nocardia amamiensis]|uniref:ABC transporter ATP-binding protein n=1 Tax=Nocardia TaxID=1817 RepID=UPI00340AAD3A
MIAEARRLRAVPDPGVTATAGLIDAVDVVKSYPVGHRDVVALHGVNLTVEEGDFVAIVGRSGSGKTTLLHLLAGIDRPTSGSASVAGASLGSLSETELARWRSRRVGLVFQFFHLLPTLTVAENVRLPMDLADLGTPAHRCSRVLELLDRVGIADQADKLPAMLSGGQQQRAAIARALANDPPLLLADEPTGNLDSTTSQEVLELFVDLNYDGRTIVVVTHEQGIRAFVKREITIADGRIVGDERLVPVRP